jgi:hypothetical protein
VVANYEGASIVFRQMFSRGLQILASYTWSHTLDVCSDTNNSGQTMNPYDWRLDYGNANWDIRNRFVASYIYELPFFRASEGFVRAIAAGWTVAGISTLQSGRPFNVTIATDSANTSSRGAYRPNLVARPSSNCGGGHLTGCISTQAFASPLQYTYGTAGRNLLPGPRLFNTDLSMAKTFPISDRFNFQFRIEAFNAWNSPQFSNPNAVFGTAAFGSVNSTSINNRQLQLGGRLSW